MNVAPSIRDARERAGLTQAQLATLVGTSQSRLSTYESGTTTPSPDMLRRLIDATRPVPSSALHRHRKEVIELASRHGFVNVRVFGSVARGDDHLGSDIDLLVTPLPGTTIFDMSGFAMEATELLGYRVDALSDRSLAPNSTIAREALTL